MEKLVNLFLDVFVAAALSFGGLAAVLSALRNSTITQHHLITDRDFSQTYALAVGAPGPNSIFLSLLGYRVAGLPGAAVAMLAWAIPTTVLLHYIGKTASSRAVPAIKEARKALVPVVAGLLVAGALSSSIGFEKPTYQWALIVISLGVMLKWPKLNPLWVVGGCALCGALLF